MWCTATSRTSVGEVIAGEDAVVSALGHAKGAPKEVQMWGTENIVAKTKSVVFVGSSA